MQLQYLQTYSKALRRIDNVMVALHQIVKTAPVFTEKVNVSVNRPLEIKELLEITLTDGSIHYVSAKFLLELIKVQTPQFLSVDD